MKERIIEKIEESEDNLEIVRNNLPESFESFKELHTLMRDGIYKRIQHTIQNILDICSIIVKEEDLEIPSSETDVFRELKENHIFSKETISKIRKMKGFRNFLVHRYGKINEEDAFRDIKNCINDFEDIFEEIRKYLR